jgi:hypothetical protein
MERGDELPNGCLERGCFDRRLYCAIHLHAQQSDYLAVRATRIRSRYTIGERSAMPLRIEDYALIGDCETAALVGRRVILSTNQVSWWRMEIMSWFMAAMSDGDRSRWLRSIFSAWPMARSQNIGSLCRKSSQLRKASTETACSLAHRVEAAAGRSQPKHSVHVHFEQQARLAPTFARAQALTSFEGDDARETRQPGQGRCVVQKLMQNSTCEITPGTSTRSTGPSPMI